MDCGCQGVCGTPEWWRSRGLVHIPASRGWRPGKTLRPEHTGLENSQRAEIVLDQAKHLCSKNNNCVPRARVSKPLHIKPKQLKTKPSSVKEQWRGKEREVFLFPNKQPLSHGQNIVGAACQPPTISQSRYGSENPVMNLWQPFGLARWASDNHLCRRD